MNALWITRLCAFKNTPLAAATARTIIDTKIDRRIKLMRRFKHLHVPPSTRTDTISEVLLYEAREAKLYWKAFKRLLPDWTDFTGRKPRHKDSVNQLLDIAYHHLAGKVARILEAHDIPPVMGLVHRARLRDSHPLVYDLMELFRADLVEAEVLRCLRLKKLPLHKISQTDIGRLLHNMNERMLRKYYVKDFKQCHTYTYYMELQILKFIKAINHQEPFRPLILPARHEDRCS